MKTTLQWIGGVLLAGMGLLMVAVSLDNLRTGAQDHALATGFLVGGLFSAAGLGLCLLAYRAGLARALARVVPDAEAPLGVRLTRLARKLGGRLTIAEAVAETGGEHAVVHATLDELASSGTCQLLVGEQGLLVYEFPEFQDAQAKLRAI
jgi:hypothetical protein